MWAELTQDVSEQSAIIILGYTINDVKGQEARVNPKTGSFTIYIPHKINVRSLKTYGEAEMKFHSFF
jgi:hypothetical protein